MAQPSRIRWALALVLAGAALAAGILQRVIDAGRPMTATEQRPAAFPWYPCDEAVRKRIVGTQAQAMGQDGLSLTRLELWMRPRVNDPRLKASTLIIKLSSIDRPDAPPLYHGPYQPRLILERVPHQPGQTLAEVSIWAFHQETETCMSWPSKNSSPLFGAGPMVIELFGRFNPEADAWFRIYPVSKVTGS